MTARTCAFRSLLACLLACLSLGCLALPAQAARPETWADLKLKVTAGLTAWYDASVENAARKAQGQPRIKDGAAVDRWHDVSGNQHHLEQTNVKDRPISRADDELRFVRFDGLSQSLASDGWNLSLDNVTVFVVAAPFSNDGFFRGLLAANAANTNDYVTGLNIDLGPEASGKFATLNVEGAGFGGAMNLKNEPGMFGQLQRICLTSQAGQGGTAVYFNGAKTGARDRAKSTLKFDRLTVGARFYTNGGPPETRGFLCGEMAEVLIYDRVLPEAERLQVDGYLQAKYGDLRTVPMPPELASLRPIPKVQDPPPVQMLVPGFAARKLPVELTNINNVRYRHDGRLVAMGYNGHIHLLRDTDNDGLEDTSSTFWDQPGIVSPIGIVLTPAGDPRGNGVFVAGRGQISLVLDTDGDDRGDKLVKVADGWKPIEHSVDAMGIALAADGSLYFGLGTENFTNGHLIDAQGKAHYAANDDRGAIFRLSPDFKQRERICSGVRFSVALAFSRAGDLFCTDQEGATWLPNGNPFDELLHIQPGRHYGFPPRHPKHLPDVVDEPSVYDYAPQHQSTCGLCFNEPGKFDAGAGKTFGPRWWSDNALVCGYSRGKLYRNALVKTPVGYVADGALIGCLNQLTVDSCLAPDGALLVATHSGGPDWGSGPGGKGTLYKIHYADTNAPQPVRAWANSPQEVQVAFDRPLDPAQFAHLSQTVRIEYGQQVRAGDRFESFWPGYSVVELQSRSPRRLLPVLSAKLTADRLGLLLSTDRHAQAVSYAVLLPDAGRGLVTDAAKQQLPQLPTVELTYNLCGVDASWKAVTGASGWSGWLPHLDTQAASALMAGTKAQQQVTTFSRFPGTFKFRTQLNLAQMLRPAVQPGAKLDAEFGPERVTLVLESGGFIKLTTPDGQIQSEAPEDGLERLTWTTQVTDAWVPIEVEVVTGGKVALQASWFTDEDPRPRAFPPSRFLLPWVVRQEASAPEVSNAPPTELAGGDWQRGREVFFGEKAQCGKCHSVRSKGGWIGPDLSNLVHRDYASVLRDITSPSFAINPDHLAYNVMLNDGRSFTGMVRNRDDKIVIGDIKGVETEVTRGEIETMKPALVSIMPEGLPKEIGEAGMRDLLTFLLTAEPGGLLPAPIERPGAPAPRTKADVGSVLAAAAPAENSSAEPLKPFRILLIAGPKDHGPGEHDYPLWQKRWAQLLARAPQVTVTTADNWPTAEQWAGADVAVLFSANPAWAPERAQELDAYFARGGGLVLLHYAVNGQRAPEEFARRVGLAWHPAQSRFRHGELDLNFPAAGAHPIVAGFTTAHFVDESYWNLVGDESMVRVLATQMEEGKPRPMLWTYEPTGGRVFASILGHYNWTFDDPLFRVLLLRGIAWTGKQPLDRFNAQVIEGARIAP